MDALHSDSFDHRATTTDSLSPLLLGCVVLLANTLLVLGVQVITFVQKKDEDNRQGRQPASTPTPTPAPTQCTANLTCTDTSTCILIDFDFDFDLILIEDKICIFEAEYDDENGINNAVYPVPCIFPFYYDNILYNKCLNLTDNQFPDSICPIRNSSTQTDDGINSFTQEDLTNWDPINPINPIPSDPNDPCTILPLFSQCNDTCSTVDQQTPDFCQQNQDLCEAFVALFRAAFGIALLSVSAVTGISLLSSGGSVGGLFGGAGGLFGGAGGLFGGVGGLFGGVGGLFGVNCPPTQCVVQGRCCPLQADSSGRNICPSNC